MEIYDIIVIGGGPAGMAAAVAAREQGVEKILIVERDRELGGILQQCIHNGFGLHHFKEDLTGPEFAERYIQRTKELDIACKLDTMVLSISKGREVVFVNGQDGLKKAKAGAIILAMGCRERTRGSLNIPGSRPAGVFTAGTAQRLINMEGYQVGKRVMMLGTGDIGLIMARRLTLEGARVLAVLARKPYPGGLMRNVVQCLHDYQIPLMLQHTIVKVLGKDRVSGVLVARTDERSRPITGTEQLYECDTLVLSVGLIPENELSSGAGIELDRNTGGPIVNESRETSVAGIFACGNVVQVHDLVDFVVEESETSGQGAARFLKQAAPAGTAVISLSAGSGIKSVVPQRVRPDMVEGKLDLFLRVDRVFGPSQLVLRDGPQIVRKVKRVRMNPSEMERIRVDREILKQVSGPGLSAEVVGAE